MSKSWVPEWVMQLNRKPKARRPEPTWTTKDGREIPVRLMDNGHLLNTIRMLERAAEQKVQDFMEYPMPNGDMAVMAWEQEFGRMCDAEVEDFFPIYKYLIAEAARRGLDLNMPAFAASRVATPDEFPG